MQKEILSYHFQKEFSFFVTFTIARQILHKQKNSDFCYICYIYHCKTNSICAEKILIFFLLHLPLQKNLLYTYLCKENSNSVTFVIAWIKVYVLQIVKICYIYHCKKNHMYRRVSKILIFVTFTIAKLECWLGEMFFLNFLLHF